MSVSFSAMTPRRAAAWLGTKSMERIRATGVVPGLVITGAWVNRRFVIAAATAAKASVAKAQLDIEAGTLSFPLNIDPGEFATACRSLGASVERLQRDRSNHFEIVGDFAGVEHTVHAYHHVSICGSRGPWNTDQVRSSPCPACALAAATKPKHRARYHPTQTNA